MESYYDLLQRDEWKSKRLKILERDDNKCAICANYNLLDEFRISYITIGKYSSGKAVIAVYDKERKISERCVTEHHITYFIDLFKIYDEKKLICLTYGEGAFCRLIAIVFADEVVNNSREIVNANRNNNFENERQKEQENYLRELDPEKFKKLKWFDVKTLHVHHKYYWLSKKPWEYPEEALQTLCWKCHEDLHRNQLVPVYNEKFLLINNLQVCPRCCGAGYIPIYRHVLNGICFQCNGNRFIP